MPGTVERDGLAHFLRCQSGFCPISIKSRIEFSPEVFKLHLDQQPIRCCKLRQRQALNLFVERLAQSLSF